MTSLKSQDLASRSAPEKFARADHVYGRDIGDNETYLEQLDEDDYYRDEDDYEQNQLIYERGQAPTTATRYGKGPTFAEVLIARLGLSRMQSRMTPSGAANPDICSAGSHRAGAKAPPQPLKLHRSPTSATRSLLLILLFLLLISGFVLVLIQLSSFVEDQKSKLAPSKGELKKIKQKLLHEIDSKLDDAHRKELEAERKSRWLVTSSKCHIPVLEPWDGTIKSYVERKAALNCSSVIEDFLRNADESARSKLATNTKSFTYVAKQKLYFTGEAIRLGALAGRCCYRLVTRSIDNDDDLDLSDPCLPIRANGMPMNRTLVEVSCGAPLNYGNVHSFMLQNSEEEAAYKQVAELKLNKNDHYNVLMLGVDTMSRLNALRQLNQTLDLLLGDLYGALDFVGYNKVGENTFPNLIPLLTGLRPNQLTETQCWLVKNYTDESERGDDYLDNCKYLWNFYQQAGYATYFSEDWPMASTFNYLKPGFKNEPTSYYGRPFVLARDKFTVPQFGAGSGCASCQLDRPIVEVDLENLQLFLEQHQSTPYFAFHWINCPQHDDLNGASQVDALLANFFHKIHKQTQDDKTFVIFFSDHGYRWNNFVSTRIGHYESSLPLLTIAPPKSFIRKHPDLYTRLKEHQNALLTPFDMFKTLIGIRDLSMSAPPLPTKAAKASGSMSKVSGKRQAAIPMLPGFANPIIPHPFPITMEVALAPAVRYPAQSGNSTMPPGGISTASFGEVKMKDGISYRQDFKTISLLEHHSNAELDRSCIDAGIPDNYCVCHQFEPIQVDRLDVLGAAFYLVYVHLESRLRNHLNLCRQLDLEKIHQAELFDFAQMSSGRHLSRRSTASATSGAKRAEGLSTQQPSVVSKQGDQEATTNKFDYLPNREYSIMFSTKPGGALYQEVVRYYGTSISDCEKAVARARKVVADSWSYYTDRHAAVQTMNSVCQFSVHSESISRFNLYKDQSKCVKSNIELKKICYCNELTK